MAPCPLLTLSCWQEESLLNIENISLLPFFLSFHLRLSKHPLESSCFHNLQIIVLLAHTHTCGNKFSLLLWGAWQENSPLIDSIHRAYLHILIDLLSEPEEFDIGAGFSRPNLEASSAILIFVA